MYYGIVAVMFHIVARIPEKYGSKEGFLLSRLPSLTSKPGIAMSNKYQADKEIYDIMRELVANHHPDLAGCVDEIAIIFREKAAKAGGKVILSKASKASDLFEILGDTPWKFIIELPQEEWLALSSRQRQANLDHCLCACRCNTDDKGNVIYSIAPPDFACYYDEFDRWGDWRPRPDEEGPSPFKKDESEELGESV